MNPLNVSSSMSALMASRRERVGRTSTVVEVGMKERAHSVDLAVVGEEVSESPVWTQWRSVRHKRGPNGSQGGGQCGVEANAEKERVCGMDPTAVETWRGLVWRQNNISQGYVLRAVVHLKRRIVATGGVDYVSTHVAIDE
jgi:hypothetical protein